MAKRSGAGFPCLLLALCWPLGTAWLIQAADLPPASEAQKVETQSATNSPAPVHQLADDELRGLLANTLNQATRPEGAEWEFHLTRPWKPIAVPDGPLSLHILEPPLSRITTSCILRFELRAGPALLGSWQTPVQARLWREVLVAPTALTRGLGLSELSLARERRDVLSLRDPLSELPADLGAYEIAEGVPAAGVITARALRLKPVVFRGQTADAVVRQGAMEILLKVEVLEEGIPGQIIRVRNSLSRRELRGKVQNEKTISILL
jgi:flagella basal body P-ring formation protein FlgA